MQKYGFREGQGLGKHEQGLSTALSVEKTSKRGGKIIVGDATEKGESQGTFTEHYGSFIPEGRCILPREAVTSSYNMGSTSVLGHQEALRLVFMFQNQERREISLWEQTCQQL